MSESTPLRKFHQTIDFDSLMREARKHITALAGEIWSDHNSSDPGITQLEVLAFCIADLSYRTSFNVKDILTGYKGNLTTEHDLPLADVALTNHPVTINDLRKVLIDMAHPEWIKSTQGASRKTYPTKLLVRNAFPVIAEGTEVDFYAASKYGRESFLTFDTSFEAILDTAPSPSKGELGVEQVAQTEPPKKTSLEEINADVLKTEAETEKIDEAKTTATKNYGEHTPIGNSKIKRNFKHLNKIELNGLYSIQLEFENDLYYRVADENPNSNRFLYDLNQNYFKETVNTASGASYQLSVLFPYWDDVQWKLKDLDLAAITPTYEQRTGRDYFIGVDKLNYDDYFYEYYAEMLLGNHKLPLFIKIEDKITKTITVNGKNYTFSVNFLDWNELSNGVNRDYNGAAPHALSPNLSSSITSWENAIEINNVSLKGEPYTFDITTAFTFQKEKITVNDDQTITTNYDKQKSIKVLARVVFEEGTIIQDSEINSVMRQLERDYLTYFREQINLETAVFEKLKENTAQIYSNYLTKLNTVFNRLYGEYGVWSYLGNYRNLCEDYSTFTASRVQEVALFGKIDVAANYNVNELLAEVYYRIDEFLSPLVKFNSLSQMTAKGYNFDSLFNGPLLQNGFIEERDLNDLKRRSVIYTSDLIRIIMDVPGVEAVEDFNISSYIDNRLMGRNVINCLNLTNSDIYKPRFSAEKTKLTVCVDGKMSTLDEVSITKWYNNKIKRAKEEQITPTNAVELQIPKGEDREIEAYYSIQHDFPEIYGIGEYGLPIDATEERKAQAKQLKAFLLPFEQLLANYLKQVAHLPELFSFHRSIENTYATQPLYNVPDVQPLFADLTQGGMSWDAFKADLDNAYQLKISEGESKADFRSRRSRFLSQLLARFGESFEAYATQMFDRQKALLNDPSGISAYQTAQQATLDKLIEDKIAFAENYEQVTARRYQSFNTTIQNNDFYGGTWFNTNIASYKLRLCRLLGIEQPENMKLFEGGKDKDNNVVDIEGMHIVEHILLRPRTYTSKLMGLNNRSIADQAGSFIYDADLDPYSFTITIVLPRNAGRFKEERFRNFTEHLIRMETPAHIRIHFKWLSSFCGKKFEEQYANWKQSIYRLKPYFFQNKDSDAKFNQIADLAIEEEGTTLADTPTDDVTFTTILDLQNQLLETLEKPCALVLKLYDKNDFRFAPKNGKISFRTKTTDVWHLGVSEIGGTITVYKFDYSANNWVSVTEFKPVEELYFDINDFLKTTQGLTENFGGKGLYKVEYALEDRTPVAEIIEVDKAIVPVDIWIGNSLEMLAFDTETDGVFRISNKHWDGFFFQFAPIDLQGEEEIIGTAMISSPQRGMAPTPIPLSKRNDSILFTKIFQSYGLGVYHITYELDGQTTFADLELVAEPVITVRAGDNIITPSDNGCIELTYDLRQIKISFDIPGGSLKVYDLDAKKIVENKEEQKELPFGTIAYYKSINELLIDRDDKGNIYQEGHAYSFVYEFGNTGVQQKVCFRLKPEPVSEIKLQLLKNGEAMEGDDLIIWVDNREDDYHFLMHPKSAIAYLEVFRESKWQLAEEEAFEVPSDNYLAEFGEPEELFREYGEGPYRVRLEKGEEKEELIFTMKTRKPKILPAIQLFQEDEQLKEEPFVLQAENRKYSIGVSPEDGRLMLLSASGILLTEITTVGADQLRTVLNLTDYLERSNETNFSATYTTLFGRAEIQFSVQKKQDPVVDLSLKIFDKLKQKEVQPVDKVYNLVFDYKNNEHQFTFEFNQPKGKLEIKETTTGKQYVIDVNEGVHYFNGIEELPSGLPSGNYEGIYRSTSGEELRFQFNVIRINPTFSLSPISQEENNYTVKGNPNGGGQKYVWRLGDEVVSQAKSPELTLSFSETEIVTIQLTIHDNGYEASYQQQLTQAQMSTIFLPS